MSNAHDEISLWVSYEYVIVNRDLDESLGAIKSILQAERLNRIRRHGLTDFVEKQLLQSSS